MKPFASAVVVGALLAASSARADDLESLLDQKVVSSASKSAETTAAAPATSTVITAEDLRRYGIRSLDEAINFLGVGMVVENPAVDQEIGARGVHFARDYGDHVLLLVNGHVLNEQWGGTAYFERSAGIPMELVDHIEILLGPGSVLYGSEAMLGVINIVTKRAKDWDGLHAIIESEIPISIRGAIGMGRTFKLWGKPGEVTIELEYYTKDGPNLTLGPQSEPGTRVVIGGPADGRWGGTVSHANYSQIPTGFARVMLGDFELNLKSTYWKRGLPMNEFAFDDGSSYELDRWISADLRHRWVVSPSIDLVSRLYADAYDYEETLRIADGGSCVPGMPKGCSYVLDGLARWVGLEEQLSIDWKRDGTITTLIGVDGRLKNVGSKTDYFELETDRTPGSFGVSDLTEKALGVYGQQILKPLKWATLNAGARVDVDERFGAHGSPRVALLLSPWDGGTLKAIYSEAFRAPTAYERYYTDPAGQIAAPDLGPETVRSFEVTFEQRGKGQLARAGFFRTVFTGLVEYDTASKADIAAAVAAGTLQAGLKDVSQYKNLATLDTYGFDAVFEGSALSSRLHYGASITGAIAKQRGAEDSGAPLVVAPSFSGNARIAYDFGGGWPTLGVASRFVGRRAAEGAYAGYGYTPEPYAPLLVEVRTTVTGKVPRVKGLSYRATLNVVSTNQSPYTVGPTALSSGRAELVPLDTVRTGLGLNYDLPL